MILHEPAIVCESPNSKILIFTLPTFHEKAMFNDNYLSTVILNEPKYPVSTVIFCSLIGSLAPEMRPTSFNCLAQDAENACNHDRSGEPGRSTVLGQRMLRD